MDNNYAWLICYLDINHIKNVQTDLLRSGIYADVTAYIPTVRVLKKQHKGENIFKDVPLLFNYGFFKVPRQLAVHRSFLDGMKRDISCIYAWVTDVGKVVKYKPAAYFENIQYHPDKDIPVATATSEEISLLIKASEDTTIYSVQELERLKAGAVITLHGYPWEGIDAKVIDVNLKKNEVKVSLLLFNQVKEVLVSFDSVFFTMYHNNPDPDDLSKVSLDDPSRVIKNLTLNI